MKLLRTASFIILIAVTSAKSLKETKTDEKQNTGYTRKFIERKVEGGGLRQSDTKHGDKDDNKVTRKGRTIHELIGGQNCRSRGRR